MCEKMKTRIFLLGDNIAFDIAKSVCDKSKGSITNLVCKNYSTIELHIAKKAVYCLLCTTKKRSEISTYLYLISQHAPDATVIVVAIDSHNEYQMDFVLNKYEIKAEFLSIDDLDHLSNYQQELFVEKNELLEKISKHDGHYILLKDLDASQEELQILHDLGYLLYYPDRPYFQDYVILNPSHVLETLERSLKNLSECRIESFSPQLDDDLRNILLSMMKEFRLAHVAETVSPIRRFDFSDRNKYFWSDVSLTPDISWTELGNILYNTYNTDDMNDAMFDIVWKLRRISVVALNFVIVPKPKDYQPGIYLHTLPNNKIVCFSKSAQSEEQEYGNTLLRHIHLFSSRWINAMLPDFPSSFRKCRIDPISPKMNNFQDLNDKELKTVCLTEWDQFIQLNGEPTERFQKWIRTSAKDDMCCLDVKYFLELRSMDATGDFTSCKRIAKEYANLGVSTAEYHCGLYDDCDEKRFQYLKRSSDKEHQLAQYEIALCYKYGFGVEKSVSMSLKYFEKVFPSLAKYDDFKDLVEIQWRKRPDGPTPFVNAERCELVSPPDHFAANKFLDPFPCIDGLDSGIVSLRLHDEKTILIFNSFVNISENTTNAMFFNSFLNVPSTSKQNKLCFEIYWNSFPVWRSLVNLE